MRRECNNCGTEDDERWMYPLNFGRKTEWYCHKCYADLQSEVTQSEFFRKKKIRAMYESSKRNK